ncbi:FG-GAP repeat domain-containing protein [Geodermatophilus sp. SYSU D00703]
MPLGADLSGIGERFSSPAVGDVDGDGVMDVVAGFPNGHVYAWRTDTGSRWLDYSTGPGAVQASPGLLDYDGDGRLDIVYANTHGDVGVLTSDLRRVFSATIGDGSNWGGAFATPAVADIDRDGRLDVVVSGFDQYLHAWGPGVDPDELTGFPVALQDTSWSSPAVGDIDGDGVDEIVVGWDCDGAPGQACHPDHGGWVGAFTGDGRPKPGWPRFVPTQVVWSTPALADLDGDGRDDVVVGTGNMGATMWDGGEQPMRGTQVFGLRGDGSDLPGWPVTVGHNVTSSPAVGDLTGDGRPEVAFVAEDGLLYAYRGDGRRMWARCAGNDVDLPPNDGTVTYTQECPLLHASPSIADVDGDGEQEVLVGGEQWVHVFDGADGDVVGAGETAAGSDPMTATPTVADVDGTAWIVEATTADAGGLTGRVFAWTTGRALGAADWPTFKGGMARSGAP